MKSVLFIALTLLCAGQSFAQKVDKKKLEMCQATFKDLQPGQCEAFAQKQLWAGETKEQVLASLGKPKSQASITSGGQLIESFCYMHGAAMWGVPGTSLNLVTVVFTDGKVTSIGGASAKAWPF
jgi:hypothetical protein